MGNTSTKSSKHEDALNLSGHGKHKLSERESTATWYRYGVPVTDVYDVVEVLGHGHMGEVFTVRRKTTGHHSDQTREKVKEYDKILQEEAAGKGKKGNGRRISTPSKKSFQAAATKSKKLAHRLSKGKHEPKLTDSVNSNLTNFIKSTTPQKFHEPLPPEECNTPVKGIMKGSSSSFSSQKSSPLDETERYTMSLDDSSSRYSRANSADSQKRPTMTQKKSVHFQRTFAVKTILTSRIQKDQVDELVNEITIMRRLDHPYVLKLYEVYHVKRKLWLVTELLGGGDLASRKHSEHGTKNVIEQVLRALVYLHRMGVVHRDIKLENILYENNSQNATVRLIDFGLSRKFDRTTVMGDYARTPYTLTPEAASTGHRYATDKSDVWAVGIIAFIMLSGEFPFIKTHEDLKNVDKMTRLKQVSVACVILFVVRGIMFIQGIVLIYKIILFSGALRLRNYMEGARYHVSGEGVCNWLPSKRPF